MRVSRWVAVFLVLVPAIARADDHRADVFLAACLASSSFLTGGRASVAVPLPWKYKDQTLLSGVGDVGIQRGSSDGVDEKRETYTGGLRFTLPTANRMHRFHLHGLAGDIRSKDGNVTGNGAAFAFGAGWEFVPEPAGAHGSSHGLGLGVQLDYIVATGRPSNLARLSVGVVYRIKH